ncbi:adenine nucleotide alpha hydrolases-like protein [Rhizoclosmatium globosum]|uniref:Adenine nucleotide alpha hydrolases-like protein n=1 Tax=Rhizoclosmatium globosum TaxID=329046 RepID=A0A1Y2D067_9FUNG|nr:adenine nucleotide alpha hydrolases-like protein [Rhizoclosmatium globosum]|eukprot:ORY52673.1 adenine nucleotide alpha hydrolases-like protein [Rhizoclosmatium globosum]
MTPVSASDAQPVSVAEVQQVKDNSTSSAPVSTARSGPAPAPAQPRITYTKSTLTSSTNPSHLQDPREARPSEHPVPLIFIDTLYHFPETLALAEKLPKPTTHPSKSTPPPEPTQHRLRIPQRPNLWQTDADTYDYLVKVEPGRRAALENHAQATITGRRGLKVHPVPQSPSWNSTQAYPPHAQAECVGTWGYDQVWSYIQENKVPYNVLHDRGYKSVGDWHSTAPTAPGENERDGRWKEAKGRWCGIAGDDAVLAEGEPVMKKQDVSA